MIRIFVTTRLDAELPHNTVLSLYMNIYNPKAAPVVTFCYFFLYIAYMILDLKIGPGIPLN